MGCMKKKRWRTELAAGLANPVLGPGQHPPEHVRDILLHMVWRRSQIRSGRRSYRTWSMLLCKQWPPYRVWSPREAERTWGMPLPLSRITTLKYVWDLAPAAALFAGAFFAPACGRANLR